MKHNADPNRKLGTNPRASVTGARESVRTLGAGHRCLRLGLFAWVSVLTTAIGAAQERVALPLLPPGSPVAVVFEAERSKVIDMGTGYQVTGDVALVTEGTRLTLAESQLFFQFAGETREIVRVAGVAYVPSPYTGEHVVIKRPALAEFGMDFGRNLDLGIPLNDDRTYFYFHFDTGFEMDVGMGGDSKPFTVAIPAGLSAMLIVDPLDPFFYFTGGLQLPGQDGNTDGNESGDGANSEGSDSGESASPGHGGAESEGGETGDSEEGGGAMTGFGVSLQSLIPFRPVATYGIEDYVRELQGSTILSGTFPLGSMPVEVSGYMISSTDSLEIGVNGHFEFVYSFLKVRKLGELASFGFDLGEATAAIQVVDGLRHAYFSGVIEPDTSWLPDFVPFLPEGRIRAYAYMSDDPADFALHTDGRYAVDATAFGELVGVDLGDVLVVEGSLDVDRNGFRLFGLTESDLGSLGAGIKRSVDLWIPFNAEESGYLDIEGLARVTSLSVQGRLHADRQGVTISGKFADPSVDLDVQAAIRNVDGTTRLVGQISVPDLFQSAVSDAVVAEAKAATESLARTYDEYQRATESYEVELSLRGMRRVIPSFCDAVQSVLASAERSAHAKINSKWPWYAPGKGSAKTSVSRQINAHRTRISTLKARVQTGDDATVRAALKAAINNVLANQVVTVRVSVLGTVYQRDVVNATQERQLKTALAAIDSLPAASNRKVAAATAWAQAPKRETLIATADEIAQGIASAVPRIVAIGFDQPFDVPQLTLFALVNHKGQTKRVNLAFDPAHPEEIGRTIGSLFAGAL